MSIQLIGFHAIQLCTEHLPCPKQGQIQLSWDLTLIVQGRGLFEGEKNAQCTLLLKM